MQLLSVWLENIFSSLPNRIIGEPVPPLLDLFEHPRFPEERQEFLLPSVSKDTVHGRRTSEVVVSALLGCLTIEHQVLNGQRYLTSLTCRLVFTLHEVAVCQQRVTYPKTGQSSRFPPGQACVVPLFAYRRFDGSQLVVSVGVPAFLPFLFGELSTDREEV